MKVIDVTKSNHTDYWTIKVAGGVCITKYIGNDDAVTIPEEIDGEKVVEIGEHAFENHKISNLILSENIKTIGSAAFKGCGIKTIYLNNSVEKIKSAAFASNDFENIIIPASVVELAEPNELDSEGIFAYCYNLNTVLIGDGVKSIPSLTFDSCSSLETVIFSGKINSIGVAAFNGCRDLKSLTLPDGLISIGSGAFNQCENLCRITIPSSVTKIEDDTFSNTEYVTIFGKEGTYVQEYANRLAILFIDLDKSLIEDNYLYEKIEDGTRILKYLGSEETIAIPNELGGGTVIEIGENTFAGKDEIKEIDLGKNIITIGSGAFYHCDGLMSIDIPDNVKNLLGKENYNSGIFSGCSNLKIITVGSGILKLPKCFASECRQLENVVLKGKMISVGDNAFTYCTNLKNINFENGVHSLGTYAFSACEGLESIYLTGLQSMSDCVFMGCSSLKEIFIPNTISNLGDGVFGHCVALRKVVIPKEITSMTELTFSGCVNLKIYGEKGSYAQTYANTYGIPFVENTVGEELSVKSFTTDKATAQYVNTVIKLTAVGVNGKTPYQYQFGYKQGSKATIIQNYSTTTTATFKPDTVGVYTLFVTIKDANGNTAIKNIDNYSIVPNLSVKTFTTDKASGQGINTSIQLSATGSDGKTPYQGVTRGRFTCHHI